VHLPPTLRHGALIALLFSTPVAALTLVAPAPGSVNLIAPGDEFAATAMADAWDMTDGTDVMLPRTIDMTAQGIAGGLYGATSISGNPYFFPLDPGIASSVPNHRGFRFPIDTARYRYLTAKIRAFAPSGPQPPPELTLAQSYFFRDQNGFLTGLIGCSPPAYYTPGPAWQIVTIDMQASTGCGPYTMPWTSGPVQGLRFDPVRAANVRFEMDWLRLTSAAVTPAQRFLVVWTDTVGGLYTVTAVDAGGARFTLGQNIGGDRLNADFTRLAPGDYRIEVARSGATQLGTGVVRIGAPATVRVTTPSERGDIARDFARAQLGNPWGPIDAGDFNLLLNFTNISYLNPPGSLSARPTNDDPNVFMRTQNLAIDTNLYRSACFTLEIAGDQDVGTGSVARWYWGNNQPTLTASDDIIIEAGLNEYCLEDLAAVPMEGANQTPWLAGPVLNFRLDPHEFPVAVQCVNAPSPVNCRDIRIDSVSLAPFAVAAPTLNLAWNHTDSDDGSHQVRIILDGNRVAGDGVEHVLATQARPTGANALSLSVPPSVPLGKWYVAVEVQDAAAIARAYSGGPVLVQAGSDLIFANGFQ
jgi:hypothetical protein